MTYRRCALLLSLVLAGCSTAKYRAAADRDTYDILRQKEAAVLGQAHPFTITTPHSGLDPQELAATEIIGERATVVDLTLTFPDALAQAFSANRQYLSRKESLFLTALALTAERHRWTPRLSAEQEASIRRLSAGGTSRGTDGRFGVTQLLKSGGSVGLTLANDLLRVSSGDPRYTASSAVSLNLAQPLLRGFGADVAAESLTQAERDVIYEIRSFSRSQRTLAVDTASHYYRLLQQQDTVRNEYSNYRNLVQARERAEALAVDRLPEFQVDQTRQDELRARNRYVNAVEQYQATLDDFKVFLGLPLGTRLRLDATALAILVQQGLLAIPLDERQALELALAERLDLLNEIDRFDDAKRKIVIADDDLRTELELFANASLASTPVNRWERYNADQATGTLGLRLKLPLDRLNERNAYRRTLIDFERQLRQLALSADQVRDDIRSAFRTLNNARQNYQIQQLSADLAARRVESANLLLQAGRAETRDLLDAQSASVQARNALTQALVDYHLARLGFLRDLDRLEISATGLTHRLPEATGPLPALSTPQDTLVAPDQLF